MLFPHEDPVVPTLQQREDRRQAGAAFHATDDVAEARELRRRT
jgi:hypothetical protein